jgi:DNA-binding CsgD family transcriptional regulator
MLVEDVVDWPASLWLVIDDYHHIGDSRESSSFIEGIVSSSSINVLITSRRRPYWITARKILYGDVFELGQSALSMTSDEAREVLADWPHDQATGLIALADGWPAVIGMAALGSSSPNLTEDLPDTLYSFFADEVMHALSPGAQEALQLISAAPYFDRSMAKELLGERYNRVLTEILSLHIIDEPYGQILLHPLARSFMERRCQTSQGDQANRVAKLADIYRRKGDWDSLFELVRRDELAAGLSVQILDSLLAAGRISTIEAWLEHARKTGRVDVIHGVAQAEVELRQGRHLSAQTLANRVIRVEGDTHPLAYRALMVAAAAAHIAGDERESLGLFRRARLTASSREDERAARWGELMCLVELESPEARAALADLSDGVGTDDPNELVREAGRRLGLELRFGAIESLRVAREREQLLAHVFDPIARCSFRSVLATALCLTAEYEAGLEVAEMMLEDARMYRLDFVRPYASFIASMAYAGMRRFSQSRHLLAEGAAQGAAMHNAHAMMYGYALEVRLLLHEGRPEDACQLGLPAQFGDLRGLEGEILGWRALALACAGMRGARETIDAGSGLTSAVEAHLSIRCAEAVIALKSGDRSAGQRVGDVAELVWASGGADVLVAAYRACPDLLATLLARSETKVEMHRLLVRAHDWDLIQRVNGVDLTHDDPLHRLTPREREIHDLVCQGLSNKQIATLFVISEATVKAHTHRIHEKLGTHSRTALVLRAARRSQATSATDST